MLLALDGISSNGASGTSEEIGRLHAATSELLSLLPSSITEQYALSLRNILPSYV